MTVRPLRARPAATAARAEPWRQPEHVPRSLLAAAAVALTGGAVYVSAVSRHAPQPAGHATVTAVVCLSFVAAGVLALRQRPYARFGLLLAAVGLSSLFGALHDANWPVPYTIGVLGSNVVFAVLLHALLAFPHGRLASGTSRLLAVAAYLDVLLVQAVAVLFDPLTRWHSSHPRNAALVAPHASLATALEELEAGAAAALGLAVVVVLAQRVRAATPAARRQLMPVLVGGTVAVLAFSVGLVLAPLSTTAAVVGIGIGLIASLALPTAFLGLLLQGRLSRAAVGELLVELREQPEAPDLEAALQRALGDPSLELARLDGDGEHVDHVGRRLRLPGPGEPRVATPIRHQGEPVGALVHDRTLKLRPELLDAVSAAAGFALANERALEAAQQAEARNRALLDAIPDMMFRIAADGTYLDVRAEDDSGLLRPAAELIGANVRDVLPPDVAEAVLSCAERALRTGSISSLEYELDVRGTTRTFESRMVPSGAGEVVTIVRDFTERRRAQAELRRLAEEQAALRRVATLVAGDAAPEEVFETVTAEVCELLGIRSAVLERFEDERTATVVARFGERAIDDFAPGTVIPLQEGLAATRVLRTGAPARVDDYERLPGELPRRMGALGFRATVAVPITVGGSTWGALIAALRAGEALPPETEQRMAAFAELVGLAVASAQARDELAASRARIVEASDAERRRLERNLHDGAQQRLVAMAVALRLAQSKIRTAPGEAEELVAVAAEELQQALTELRELAQGLHPAVLTERGLGAALAVLAARTPLPVRVEGDLPERLPPAVEAAAYYVVSEALANVVKHARADEAAVRVERLDGLAVVEVCDDGAGGADPAGSGLRGLRDRVETLAGRLVVESERGRGTRVRAEFPLR